MVFGIAKPQVWHHIMVKEAFSQDVPIHLFQLFYHRELRYGYLTSSSSSSSSPGLSSIPRNRHGITGVIGLVSVCVENLLLLLIGLTGGLSKSMLFHLLSISSSILPTSVGAVPMLPTLRTVSSTSPFSHESAVWYRSRLFRLDRGKYEFFLR
jgi:hypothetical protein